MDRNDFIVPLRLLGVSLLVFGLLYQGSLMAVGTVLFPNNVAGSPITYDNGTVAGSAEIGQDFRPGQPEDAQYFWSRPSSNDYDAMTSGSANLAPNNPALSERVRSDLRNISQYETSDDSVPANLVAESGSAYDAYISPEAARFQVPRVANQTGISEERLHEMIEAQTEDPWMGVYGHERVSVLELNLMIREELQQQQNSAEQNSDVDMQAATNGDH